MAKLTSWTKFVGTLGGITFYLMNGKHFARQAKQEKVLVEQVFCGNQKDE
ncbi:hypothetical protein [Aquiflexum gelatinilyticum]|nr:hypothetical protein [Aquiflexum gelatinilyticum]MCS4433663.1 hypothetical protein [Aquiflexum gelatinilyticum]